MSFTMGRESESAAFGSNRVCCSAHFEGAFGFRPVAGGKGRLFEVETPTKQLVRELKPADIQDIEDADWVSGVLGGLNGIQGRKPKVSEQRESLSLIEWRLLAGRRGNNGR